MTDLYIELQEKIAKLQKSVEMLKDSGRSYAKAERDYKVALNQKALEIRVKEDMPVTLINQVIYGYPDIAKLRFERDCAEAYYKANMEAINSYKLQIRILEGQIQREWSNGDYITE